MKHQIASKVQGIPYDHRHLLRKLAAGGCRYAAATLINERADESSDPALATEYQRVLLVGDETLRRAFEAEHRDQMIKKTSKSEDMKKAFTDVQETAPRVLGMRVGGRFFGQIVSCPRAERSAVVAGVDVEGPDAFLVDGVLHVVVFSQLVEDHPEMLYRWWDRLAAEAAVAMKASGHESCVLVGVKSDGNPIVRAVALTSAGLNDDFMQLHSVLGLFHDESEELAMTACNNGSCSECCRAAFEVEVEPGP